MPQKAPRLQNGLLVILPASGQKHGFLNEDRAGQQDVPAAANVVRAERHNINNVSNHIKIYIF